MAFEHLPSGRAAKPAVVTLFFLMIVSVYAFSALTDSAFADQATVAWDQETSPGLAGYKVYWGTVSKNYSWYADAGPQTTYTVPSLSQGATYYIAATAYDANHTESGFSNEVVYKVPSACSYATTPASQSFGAGGGTGTVTVSTGPACRWTASNPPSWISITSGGSGTGNGTIIYSAAANTGTAQRTAGFTIAGSTFTVSEAGAQTYTITAGADSNGTISPGGTISVVSGASQAFSIAPATGYKVANVLVDGSSVGPVSSYTFTNVIANHTISASFAALKYTLSVSTGGTGNGTVTSSPTGTTFNAGTPVTLTATPGANSTFAGWSGACAGATTTCAVTMNANLSVGASFNTQTYTITASAGTGGSISPSGSVNVSAGSSQTFTLTPTSGYKVANVLVDGASVGAVNSYTFSSVSAGHTISASFAALTYTLGLSTGGAGSGTVTSSPTGTTFSAGTSVTLTAAPGANSTFGGWSGACTGTAPTCTVTMNSNLSVTATFNLQTYQITASAGTGGSISPSGSVNVSAGSSQTLTLTPTSGYKVANVLVDGASVGAVNSYTFSSVSAGHTISASFAALTYTLGLSTGGAGSGTVTSSPTGTTFSAGTSVTLTAAPGANSTFGGWSGACTGTAPTCTVTMNSNLSVTATFNLQTYQITASAGPGGTISPSPSVSVNGGGSQTFNITPNSGNTVQSVLVDGSSVGQPSSYTFPNVAANHTIQATFAPARKAPPAPPKKKK